ncbi:MAG: DUF87 domain-containing protein [candidate division WOR-3 bacterium]
MLKEIIKSAEIVGNVFSRYTYGIDKVYITLRKTKKLPLGSYVFVLDEDGLPIVYQVASPEYYRYGYDFEKRLIAHGSISKDESHTYDCIGILVGKLYEDGKIEPPKYPIVPLSEVYICPPDLVKLITEPNTNYKVKVGEDPLTSQPVYIDLRPLIRQGLLISGAQGTGKTTALLTLIFRSLETFPNLRFMILDWTGEFRPLLSLKDKGFRICLMPWDKFIVGLKIEDPEAMMRLIGEEDPRARAGAPSEVVFAALVLCKKRGEFPTKEKVKDKINQLLRSGRREDTISAALSIVDEAAHIPEKEPQEKMSKNEILQKIQENNVLIIDFTITESKEVPDDFEVKKRMGIFLAKCVWEEATQNREFGCIIVSDEAHRIAPEKFYGGEMDPVWMRLATEGGRNGCPLWLVARRLSLVSKAVTTELQQNFICFNVEDVDRKRIIEDLGETFASLLGALPPGEALVKSAAGFKVPGQVRHIKFDKILEPSSVKYGLEERFKSINLAKGGKHV